MLMLVDRDSSDGSDPRSPFRKARLPWPSSNAPEISLEARFPAFVHMAAGSIARLARLVLCFIGTGGVGLHAVDGLARCRPRCIYLIDPGVLKPESVQTHLILPEDVGSSKVDHAAGRIARLSKETDVWVFQGEISQVPAFFLRHVDAFIVATDNLLAERDSGLVATLLGKLLIRASVHGPTGTAQVAIHTNASSDSPCPTCLFNHDEWVLLNEQAVLSCSADGGPAPVRRRNAPTMTPPSLCALAGGLAVLEVLRHVLGLGKPLEDRLLSYCAYTQKIAHVPLVRSVACPCEHTPYQFLELGMRLESCTPLDLLSKGSSGRTELAQSTLEVEGHVYCEAAHCCGLIQQVRRWVPDVGPYPTCQCCGEAVSPTPFFSRRRVRVSELGPSAAKQLGSLGAGQARWVVVRRGGAAVLLHREDQT
jgi:molybdopterin/thiamine biosynthesis adenylyltransferase